MEIVNVIGPHWSLINTGSSNGLVPLGNNLLPEIMLTKFYVAVLCHQGPMS